MPSADTANTTIPRGIVAGLSLSDTSIGGGATASLTVCSRRRPNEAALLAACNAAMRHQEATDLLTKAVAQMAPTGSRHEASYAVVEALQSVWRAQIDRICMVPAVGKQGIEAKAACLDGLIERDEHDEVQGSPALRLAASLATDVLTWDWD